MSQNLREGGNHSVELTSRSQRYYLRLGDKQEGYFKKVVEQVDAGIYNPPRHENIKFMQRKLHQLLSDDSTSMTLLTMIPVSPRMMQM